MSRANRWILPRRLRATVLTRLRALELLAVALGEQLEARRRVDQPPWIAVDRRPADLADPGLEAGAIRDRDLPASLFWEFATIAELADHLAETNELTSP